MRVELAWRKSEIARPGTDSRLNTTRGEFFWFPSLFCEVFRTPFIPSHQKQHLVGFKLVVVDLLAPH